jgi:hypothetical protein
MDLHTETVTSVTASITSKIFQLHFQYRCTVAHMKSSFHTIHLYRQTFCVLLFRASGFHLETLKTESESDVTTDGQLASLSWYKASIRGLRPDFYYCTEYGIRLTVTFLSLWGTLSDERTGLSFVCAAGPCQRSLSRVLVPWDLRPYFTVSDLRLPFSSPPTTRRVMMEVFDPASTRVSSWKLSPESYVTTDSQSASLSWYKAPICAYDQIFIPILNF